MTNLSLDLRNLQCAISAAEAGSFRRAAETLGLPQSSVSRRIQLLERRLGFPLFIRSPAGIQVTPAGRLFLESAVDAAERFDGAAREAVAVHRRQSRDLRVGVSRTSGRLLRALGAFRARYPAVRMMLGEYSHVDAQRSVAAGELDVAFVHRGGDLPTCATKELWREGIYVVLPRDHRLSSKAEVTWADIGGETFVSCVGGPCSDILDCLTMRLVSENGLPNIEVHAVSEAGIYDLVAMGYGITLTNDSVVRTEPDRLAVRPMRGEAEAMSMMAIWRKHGAHPVATKLVTIAETLGRDDRLSR
ncbi:LysR family transcriptional regulator [Sphingomonas sp. AP4-R1]|uniref:LysR family transcriptional regulator n=1 Tax=Sphingomonas sp. AP4-R1 TaxID=2735134 RepID=UPI0014938C3F|nr:LysR family transcriptional regulator [Sphingomonas sp. AP4-R1]QJU57151.1 LysR family transcriptional regulator [Sphingomonas sp. AP4-R1]